MEESFSQFEGLSACAFEAVACDVEEADGCACFADLARDSLAGGEEGGEGRREVDDWDGSEGGRGCGCHEARLEVVLGFESLGESVVLRRHDVCHLEL